jgi:broad specificity phosphatase PhoE
LQDVAAPAISTTTTDYSPPIALALQVTHGLTALGRQQAASAAEQLAALPIQSAVFLTSDYTRGTLQRLNKQASMSVLLVDRSINV